MEKSNKRSVRRHHVERLKKSRAHYNTMNWWDGDLARKRLGFISQYPKKCSCHMCGNSRKWFNELTLNEKRHLDIMHDGLEEAHDEQD